MLILGYITGYLLIGLLAVYFCGKFHRLVPNEDKRATLISCFILWPVALLFFIPSIVDLILRLNIFIFLDKIYDLGSRGRDEK